MSRFRPSTRIVCLAAEAADIIVRLGAGGKLVGVSSFAQLPEALAQIPRIGGFSTPTLQKVISLEPDLIIATSDVQADAVAILLKAGLPVLALNPHRLCDIEQNIHLIGAALGVSAAAKRLAIGFATELASLRVLRAAGTRPAIFFEEWPDPLVGGIGWVGDLIDHLGGLDVFAELRSKRSANERRIDPNEVLARNPDLIVASWCGKPVEVAQICARPGWDELPAVRMRRVHEIHSDEILQAGPNILRGARALSRIITDYSKYNGANGHSI